LRLVATCLCLLLGLGAAVAATDAEIERYWELADLDVYVEQTVKEGLEWGEELDSRYLSGRGGAPWKDALSNIFDRDRIEQRLRHELHAALAPADLNSTLEFLSSDLGQRAVELEYAAREALVDWDTWDAAQRMAAGIDAVLPRREQLFARLLSAGDYFELIVASGLEGQKVFLRATTKDGKFGSIMSEDALMAWLAAQESFARAGYFDWVNAFYFIAYHDLTDDEIQVIVDYAEREDTIIFTRAVLRAFDSTNHESFSKTGEALAKTMDEEPL
jgi:hypothetical protein